MIKSSDIKLDAKCVNYVERGSRCRIDYPSLYVCEGVCVCVCEGVCVCVCVCIQREIKGVGSSRAK